MVGFPHRWTVRRSPTHFLTFLVPSPYVPPSNLLPTYPLESVRTKHFRHLVPPERGGRIGRRYTSCDVNQALHASKILITSLFLAMSPWPRRHGPRRHGHGSCGIGMAIGMEKGKRRTDIRSQSMRSLGVPEVHPWIHPGVHPVVYPLVHPRSARTDPVRIRRSFSFSSVRGNWTDRW